MNETASTWYRVPEVWLILVLLAGMVAGSLALVATAVRHGDELVAAPGPLASPLPPAAAARPADDATP
ncbi:MAG TPA: hypothetical protein VFB32_15970 [Rudaea sp.]|nr:hypothetical protein [Rudaea sp.]